jgi:hypothetical protein
MTIAAAKQKDPLPFFMAIGLSFNSPHSWKFISGTNFLYAIIGFWVFIIYFLLTCVREKVNNNEIFW